MKKCYSQEYVAKQLNIQQSTYQRIETGKVKISTTRLSRLALIFNKPIEAFFGGEIKITNDDFENQKKLMKEIIAQKEANIKMLEEAIVIKDNIIKDVIRQIGTSEKGKVIKLCPFCSKLMH